jgi:hypothetical protein
VKLYPPSRQNLNLVNATAVNTAGMASRDEILDILLISHNNGRLSDVQLLCLEDELKINDFAQSNCNQSYAPFNWENYDEVTCQHELRFEKADILRLQRCLQIPDEVKFYKGSYCQGLESLCILLRRLAYPVRYCDMVPRFGRSVPDLCKIIISNSMAFWTISD